MNTIATTNNTLSKGDLIIGTVIALVMGTIFMSLSSGMSLIVTFVPGLVFTWLAYVWLHVKKTKLPDAAEFIPVFFVALSVQFIHFAEEFTTGFYTKFAVLYGGAPYSVDLFVIFNMVAYFIFTLACVLVFTRNLRFLLLPVLFYVIYGAIGNAISHTWWSLYLRSYFPGLVTAQLYWVAGPFVLNKLFRNRRDSLAIIVLFAIALIILLTAFAMPDALSSIS
jgi:hypothetical protein